MKAKIKETGEIVDVYHEPQHGQITNIYKESVFVNGRIWTEDELEFIESKEVNLDKEVANWWKEHYKNLKNDYKFENYNGHYMDNSTIISLAQYFFELGLKTKKDE